MATRRRAADFGHRPPTDVRDDHAKRVRVHSLCTNSGEAVLGKFQVPAEQDKPKCPRCKGPMVSGSIVYDTNGGS